MPSRLLPSRTTVTEMDSFMTRWSPKHYKSTLINDHRDTFPSKCVTVVKDIIARRPLDVNREAVILFVVGQKTGHISGRDGIFRSHGQKIGPFPGRHSAGGESPLGLARAAC